MKRALLVLVLLQLFLFAPSLLHTGFYLDDWALLRLMRPDGALHFWEGVRAYAGSYWNRPLQIVFYPLLVLLGGLSPLRYRLVILLLEVAAGAAFWAWARRVGKDNRAALAAAVLLFVHPAYTAIHYWWTMTTEWVSFALVFASLVLHLDGREKSDRRRLFAAQACYLLSLLEYEAFAFLPFAALATGGGLRPLAPYAGTLGASVLVQRLVLPALLGPTPRPSTFSIRHLFEVFGAGAACLTTRSLALVGDAARRAAEGPWLAWAVLAAGAALLAWLSDGAEGRVKEGKKKEPSRGRALAATGLLLILAAYLPYVLSGVYTPRVEHVLDRVNLGAAAGLALIAAAALGAVSDARVRRAVLFLALAAGGLHQWAAGRRWADAWTLERVIVADVAPRLPPGDVAVLLHETPHAIGGAPVFQNHFDFSCALMFLGGRPGVRANWIYGASAEKDGFKIVNGDGQRFTYPYENLFVYFGSRRALARPSPPKSR